MLNQKKGGDNTVLLVLVVYSMEENVMGTMGGFSAQNINI